jgi:hypothetical protein
MYIDAKEMGVFEICRKREEILPTIKRFEKNIVGRNHDEDSTDIYDKAFTK